MRVRIGVGDKPSRMDLKDHVLGHFSKEDAAAEAEAFGKATDAVLMMMDGKIEEAMNRYNRKVPVAEEE